MVIFSASLSAFVALTRGKFDAIEATSQRGHALSIVEERLDRLRVEGLQRTPQGVVDAQSFRLVEEFGLPRALPAGQGRVDARRLKVAGGSAHGLYEVRVSVSWETIPGDHASRTWLSVSTVTGPPAEEGR
jgi:hypothetical protein